jgi:hypothetical protein
MSRRLHTLVVCLAASTALAGRSGAQEFDAAAIHASAGLPSIHLPMLDSSMRGGQMRQGRYEVQGATLVDLIGVAYRLDTDRIFGGPPWINTGCRPPTDRGAFSAFCHAIAPRLRNPGGIGDTLKLSP